jgi:hypothetical protein
MLIEILLAGKSFTGMPLAVMYCAPQLLLRAAVLAVDFSLVS